MAKSNLREYARRELTKRLRDNGPMLTRWKVIWSPVLLVLCLLIATAFPGLICSITLPKAVWLTFVAVFALSIPFFMVVRLTPLYVFGHEMTHWLCAKCFGKATGKLSLKATSGSLEIPATNWVIVLAPYCFPLYFFIFAGLLSFAGLFWQQTPSWLTVVSAAVLGACAGYHAALTFIALRHGQEDIHYCGAPFAVLAITAGNLLFFYLSFIIATGSWQKGFQIPRDITTYAITRCIQCVEYFFH